MSAFWHWFVVVVTAVSILGALWLLFSNAKGKMSTEDTGHVWDDDLREYNNPLPRWWLNMFVLTAIFGLGYLIFYPGLGNITGKLGWTSQQEMQVKLDELTAQRKEAFARLQPMAFEQLMTDAGALALGKSVFLNNCAGCHGPDAAGARGYPNLVDNDWLYGSDADSVIATITNGRIGMMPPFGAVLSEDALNALVAFVPHWADPTLPAATRDAGMAVFSQYCVACHGPSGDGNPMLGAPRLNDEIWLWGSSAKTVRETIVAGRQNQMPAHSTLLTADEIRVVAAYVKSLGKAQSAALAAPTTVAAAP